MVAHDRASKPTRTYTLKRRAERQAETRQRIVEAAVALHGSVGPAQTTFSMVAERAGVQRHTLYAHFPDEASLLLACSGHHLATDPPPDATPWRGIPDRRERLATGLRAVYGWYERNAALLACVTRDAEHHAPTREVAELRFGPFLAGWLDVLGAGLSQPQHAMLRLARSSQEMLRRALNAFSEVDAQLARAVLEQDDAIDAAQDQIVLLGLETISRQPDSASQGVDLILVAKNLERVGDHATNIAEDVILMAEARNVKHAAKLGEGI